ncbi:hypothetical protein DRW03_27385 [Corallococcus sp. H22C18031201]|nr:hypothetical protein DRW03_27385 [Corallococcus sp. H22C18031201]
MLVLGVVAGASVAQSPPPREAGEVRVHIDTESPDVELFRVTGEGVAMGTEGSLRIEQFRRECKAPCNLLIPRPDSAFFVGGKGVTRSRHFSLLDQGADVSLQVRVGSASLRSLGWFATAAGIIGIFAGSGMLLASTSNELNIPRKPALMSLVGGGALFAIGLPLLVFNGTDVSFGSAQPGADGLGRASR